MSASDPGVPSGSSLGGKRIPGQRSDKAQNNRDAAIRATKDTWGVSEFMDIFPRNIRPQGELGDSAVFNLRQISRKVPELAAARLLMTNECVDPSGRPSKLSFKNTSNILAHLKALEAKVTADAKDKKEEKDKVAPKVPASKNHATSIEDPTLQPRLAAALASMPTGGFAGAKASAQYSPATSSDLDNTALNKPNVSMPTMQPGKTGKFASKIVPHTSLMGVKSNNKEAKQAVGLHAPSGKDVAPFSSKTLAAVRKVNAKRSASFAQEEDLDEPTTSSLLPSQGEDASAMSRSGVPRLMTDENSAPSNISKGQSNLSAKRDSDGVEEPNFEKLKFDKESILADLNFKRRKATQKDSYIAAGQTPSETETEIDIESVPKLLADNVAIQYGFNDDEKMAADEGTEKKLLRDEIAAPEVMKDGLAERRKSIKTVRRRWAVAVSGTNVNAPNPASNLNMSTTKQQVEKKMANEETPKVGKAPSSYLESPVSPKNSPDREETINSSVGRRLSEMHNSKRAKITGSFSPTREVRNNRTLGLENTSLSSNLTIKTGQGSSMPKKDIMEYIVGEVVDQAKERSTKSTKAGEPALSPKALVTPAKGASANPRKPNSALPKLPETLTARIPADRALITSIPGIIKAYINELRAAIPDGKGPDGDLLSMIIVNKYGYFLEHVEKLDEELISLYYEAEDRNP